MNLYRLVPILLGVLCFLALEYFKHPDQEWDRLIESDGKGYYAWLPATFIYQDEAFGFYDSHEQFYYPRHEEAFRKDYRVLNGGDTINKYFPGPAVAWTPFFLAVHAWQLLSGGDASGYSLPYQYGIAFATLCYLLLALYCCRKLLLRYGFSEALTAWCLVLTVAGTHVIYYASTEPSVAHVTLFGLSSAFLLIVSRLADRFRWGWLTIAFLLLSIIAISRPTTILVVAFIPFLISWSSIKRLFLSVLQPRLIVAVLPALIVFLLPFIAWKIQTGNWIVYSYGDEKLNLLSPHLFKFLFSFEKGIFIHTPLLFFGLIGIAGMWKRNRSHALYFAAALFLVFWVLSSWWCWHYTSRFSNRALVDFAFAFPLLFAFSTLLIKRRIFFVITSLLLLLNLWQFYQHAKGITPFKKMTASLYVDNFFSYVSTAESKYRDLPYVARWFNNMEKNYPEWSEGVRIDHQANRGRVVNVLKPGVEYSSGLHVALPEHTGLMLTAGGMFHSSEYKSGATFVLDVQRDGQSVGYYPFFLDQFAWKNEWRPVAFDQKIPAGLGDSVKFYVWLPREQPETIMLDDLFLEIRFMNDIPAEED